MLALAALLLAPPGQYDPEIEAIMRRRKPAEQPVPVPVAPAPAQEEDRGLAAVLPPAVAARLTACIQRANEDAQAGIAQAQAWLKDKGDAPAGQCLGYAQGRAGQWSDAAGSFEAAAGLPAQDSVSAARLWAQAGNAALIASDAKRALRDLDQALAAPLPQTLATGEIHLDRARARVKLDDQPGARVDLDSAIRLAAADPLAWLLSATLARRMNDLPLARLHIAEAVKRARDDAGVALEEGIILALSGQDAGARASFSRAAELSPGSDVAAKAQAYIAQLGPAPKPAAETAPAR